MKNVRRSTVVLATAFVIIFASFYFWQHPGLMRGRLTATEIDRAVAYIDSALYLPPEEKAHVLGRLRTWAEADDGRPVYMLNLMRYNDAIIRGAGIPDFKGTPKEANAYYENSVMPMLLRSGNYPVFGSETQGATLLQDKIAGDLSRILVVRYSSRRDFLNLLTDPAYAPFEPYKLMALQVALTPTSGDIIIPDASLAFGAALLTTFLFIGWVRATGRRPRQLVA
jgi:hypothetical protein